MKSMHSQRFSSLLSLPILLYSLLLAHSPLASAVVLKSVTRPDLAPALSKALCQSEPSPYSLTKLWSQGIYDAQLEGQTLKGDSVLKLPEDKIPKIAEQFAAKNQHGGFAAGRCDQNSLWVVSTPSPSRLATLENNSIVIDVAAAREKCKSVKVDYAAAKGGKPRSLNFDDRLSRASIHLNLLDAGTLSITCKPNSPQWLGPMVWYIFPVNKGPMPLVPHTDALDQAQGDDGQKLLNWINAVRSDNGLQTLASAHPQLNLVAKEFVRRNGTIRHDLRHFQYAQKKLKKLLAKFIGENRVRSNDIKTMAWLLWNSPQHRAMLLHQTATHVAVATQQLKEEKLAVITFASF